MPYPYSVHKTYVDGETLTATDLNATDTNHISNNIPESIDDYSASIAEQRTTSDPDLDGSGNAPTTLAEELEGLRHQLTRISTLLVGGTYWYNLVGTAQIQAPAGTAATPSYTFNGDTSTGLFSSGTSTIGITVAGTAQYDITANQFLAPDGAVGTPGFGFLSDSDTGVYLASAGNVSIAAAGTAHLSCGSDIVTVDAGQIAVQDGDVNSPALIFANDTDNGIYRTGANAWSLSAGGTRVLSVNSGGITSRVTHAFSDGTASTPSIHFTNDSDTGLFLQGTNSLSIATNGTERVRINSSGQINGIDGTSGAPTYSFLTSTTTGMYLPSAGVLSLISNSGAEVQLASNWAPATDNTISTGQTGKRWTAVWAVNGTIQTSHSSTKQDIRDIENDETIEVPQGIKFKRPNESHDHVGFLADRLPSEAFALKADGTRSTEEVYTSSVIGILCAKVRKLTKRIEALEAL